MFAGNSRLSFAKMSDIYVKIELIATYFFSLSFSAWMRFFATLTFLKKLCQLIWKFFASLSTWKDIIKKLGE